MLILPLNMFFLTRMRYVVHFAMCWLGLFLPCPGVLFALSVARYYYKGKSMYSPNIGLVISHSIEPCFECIPTLDNALWIYFGVIGLPSPFVFWPFFSIKFYTGRNLIKWWKKMIDNFDMTTWLFEKIDCFLCCSANLKILWVQTIGMLHLPFCLWWWGWT